MSEMIERVAKAIYESAYGPQANWENLGREQKSEYLKHARAAIAAMRKPTQGMLEALNRRAQCISDIDGGWCAAIDEALK